MNLKKFHEEIMEELKTFKPNRPDLFEKFWSDSWYGDKYLKNPGDEFGCYFRWLSIAVKKLQPKNILELGNDAGASTLCIYTEMPSNAKFISVNITRNLRCVPEPVFQDNRIRFVFGNDIDPSIFNGNPPKDIDFLFIDTDHNYKHLKKESEIYFSLCKNGCLIIFDDVQSNDLPKFWNELNFNKLDITEDCHSTGFGIAEYSAS
jgi:predicted O-methyltransferase YrrM